METASLYRLTALAGVLCGAFTALSGGAELLLGDKTAVTAFLSGTSLPFGLAFLAGLYLRQRVEAGTFGAVAFALNFLGLAFFGGVVYTRNFVLLHLDRPVIDRLLETPALTAFLVTAVFGLVGGVLAAVAMVRAAVVPRAAVALYAAGYAVLCLTFLLPVTVVRTGHLVAGAGIVWLSRTVWALSARRTAVRVAGA